MGPRTRAGFQRRLKTKLRREGWKVQEIKLIHANATVWRHGLLCLVRHYSPWLHSAVQSRAETKDMQFTWNYNGKTVGTEGTVILRWMELIRRRIPSTSLGKRWWGRVFQVVLPLLISQTVVCYGRWGTEELSKREKEQTVYKLSNSKGRETLSLWLNAQMHPETVTVWRHLQYGTNDSSSTTWTEGEHFRLRTNWKSFDIL